MGKVSVTLLVLSILALSPLSIVQKSIASEGIGGPTYLDVIYYDEEEDNLRFPSFVMAEPVMNEIYVIDGWGRVIIYNSDFFPLFTLTKKNGIENPQGLAVDAQGNLYVGRAATKDEKRNFILVYNACIKWERSIYLGGFEGAETFVPYRIVLDKQGNIYVAGVHYPGILILNNEGKMLEILSPEKDGKKVMIINVTLDKNGRLYLVSEEEGSIYVYDENRKFLFKFGEKGGSSGKLSRPRAIGVDSSGRMYVVDYMRHGVNVYDKKGTYILEFGGMGVGGGWFQHPTDITIDSNGRIFVSNTFNDRIEVFNPL
ncbi:MAG: NHL repeat-containing protein [Deltaproteobacteria bacterium]